MQLSTRRWMALACARGSPSGSPCVCSQPRNEVLDRCRPRMPPSERQASCPTTEPTYPKPSLKWEPLGGGLCSRKPQEKPRGVLRYPSALRVPSPRPHFALLNAHSRSKTWPLGQLRTRAAHSRSKIRPLGQRIRARRAPTQGTEGISAHVLRWEAHSSSAVSTYGSSQWGLWLPRPWSSQWQYVRGGSMPLWQYVRGGSTPLYP